MNKRLLSLFLSACLCAGLSGCGKTNIDGGSSIARQSSAVKELGSDIAVGAKPAPVDSYVTPEPWDMPGYDAQVIMAAGAFVSGSSIELSADGPIKPPYAVYFQGGLTWQHAKFGILKLSLIHI